MGRRTIQQIDKPLPDDWVDREGKQLVLSILITQDESGEREEFYALTNICRIFWLDTQFWQARIHESDVLSEYADNLDYDSGAGGKQRVVCLHGDGMGYLLGTMGTKRINPTGRMRLLPFQRLIAKLARMALRGDFAHLGDIGDLRELVPVQSAPLRALPPGNSHEKRLTDVEGFIVMTHERVSDMEARVAKLERNGRKPK